MVSKGSLYRFFSHRGHREHRERKKDFMKLIKKICFKILNEVMNHLAKYITGLIILGLLALCLFSWRWLARKHSLETFGWLWILIFLAISGLPILLFLLITKKQWKPDYTDEIDIQNSLRHWFQSNVKPQLGANGFQYTMNFSNLDQSLGLPSGSTKRYIENVVKEFEGWQTKNKGEDTIVIFHDVPLKNIINGINRQQFADNNYDRLSL